MKKSERILLVTSICMVAVLLLTWGRGSKGKSTGFSGTIRERLPEFTALPDMENSYIVAYAEKRLEFLPLAPGMKDPFGVAKEEAKAPVDTSLKLTGLFRGGDPSYAFINGKLVRQGKSINGWKLIEVKDDGVWLRRGEVKRFLKLHTRRHRETESIDKTEEQLEQEGGRPDGDGRDFESARD